jgi:hypothetical protein
MEFRMEPQWKGRNVALHHTADELQKMDAIWLELNFMYPGGFQVIGGTVDVFVNSSIRKEFPIPPQKPEFCSVVCVLNASGGVVDANEYPALLRGQPSERLKMALAAH